VSGEDCGAATGADVAEVAALPGEAKYAGCAACHGPNGGGGIGPQLAGRDADYIIGRLTAYKANETVGAQSALMWGQAAMLSEDDMQQLAEYITTF
jgi:cytochrome c553